MATTLQFYDGTTTVSLISGASGYGLLYGEWMPRVATRRKSQMGGRSPYTDVQEEMRITIEGSSTVNLLAKLQTLVDLFDQANAWTQDDAGNTAVKIQYKHNDSSTTVSAVIFDTEIILPREFTAVGHARGFKLGTLGDPVILRFMRRGLWLGATETEVASTSSGNPAIMTTAAFTDTYTVPVPYDVRFDTDSVTTGYRVAACQAFLLFSDAADKIYFSEAESLSLGTDVSSIALGNSSGGSVARCDSSNDTDAKSLYEADFGASSIVRNAAFWAVVRNRSPSTVSWDIWLEATAGDNTTYLTAGRKTTIAAGDNNIKIVPLGIFVLPFQVVHFYIYAQNDVTGTVTTDDLDIDYVCGVAMDESTRILEFPDFGTEIATVDDVALHIEHRLDSNLMPVSYWTEWASSTEVNFPGYYGNATLSATGNQLSSLLFGALTSGTVFFTVVDTNGVKLDTVFRATRTAGYLTPL